MVTIENLNHTQRVSIPRENFPANNIALIIGIIGSLTRINGPVENTEERVVFNFDINIPKNILILFLGRWGIDIDGFETIG